MSLRTGLLAFCVVLAAGCARSPGQGATAEAGSALRAVQSATPSGLPVAASARAGRLARLADRGELVAYPGHAQRMDGAYTWHRADVSEDHALRAMADGHLRLTTPEGRLLDVRYDHHVEHPSGDWTWVGHLPDDPSAQTLITFGEHAVFGSIAQPDGKPALRLTMRDGVAWLVETDPVKVAGIINAATRPTRPDYHIVRKADLPGAGQPRALGAPIASASAATATATGTSTVDLLIGYTAGLVTAYGSTSAVVTRLNYLVDVANAALSNSRVTARVRLVHTMQVSYTDLNTNDKALEELSGYKSGTGPVTPNSAFTALRNARETYGADLVSLIRPFKDPEQDSCGLAWLLGGQKQGIAAGQGWDDLAYSVVSDGDDKNEADGKTYFCRDESLAHEMGHNEGSAHDRATAKGDDGVLNDPDDYGAYQYSFGYKTSSSNGNFYTVMAYGDSGQTGYRVFSNPRITFCGGHACGTTTYEDNARSLSQTIPVVAGFRATKVPMPKSAPGDFQGDGKSDLFWRNGTTGEDVMWPSAHQAFKQLLPTVADTNLKVVAIADFDGDGHADLLWRNTATGDNTIWRSADRNTRVTLANVAVTWKVAGAGDFNGDGKADILWRDTQSGANVVWNSAQRTARRSLATVSDQHWIVAAVADFNGDGHDDILWRHTTTGANTIWRSGDRNTKQAVTSVADTTWEVAGAGDFDGNGRDDIFWRNRNSGANTLWFGASSGSKRVLTALAAAWSAAGIGDYDGDGQADLFWRNRSSGADVIWFSASSTDTRTEGTVSSQAWQVQP